MDLENYHQLRLESALAQHVDVVHSVSHYLPHVQDWKEDAQIQAIGARVVY